MLKLSRYIYVLLLGTFIERFSHFLLLPFLSIYLSNTFNYDGLQIGFILSLAAFTAIIMSFFSSPLIDYFNKSFIVYLSLLLTIISFSIFPFLTHYWEFMVFSIINSAGNSLSSPTFKTLLTFLSENHKKKLVFNIRYYLINTAAISAPVLSSQLQKIGIPFICLMIVLIYIANFISFFLIFKISDIHLEGRNEKFNYNKVFIVLKKNKTFTYTLLGGIFFTFGYSQLLSTFPKYFSLTFHNYATNIYSILLFTNGLVALTCQYFIYWLNKKNPSINSIILGSFLLPSSLFVIGLTQNISFLIIAIIIFTLGEMLVFTTLDIRVDEISTTESKGTYYSLLGLQNIGPSLAPIIGGILIDKFSSGILIFVFISLITFLSTLFFYLSKKTSK